MNTNNKRINPFFEEYGTPHNTIPFHKIRLEDYEEALMEGIRRDDEEIQLITGNPDEPTFDNTLIFKDETKGEHYYDLLDRASQVMACMMSCETNDEMEALAQKMSPILTKHANDVSMNPELFRRIKYVYEKHRELTPEETRLLENAYKGFVRSGALLNEEDKEKLRKLTEEVGLLTLQFSQNLLKERKAFEMHITDEEQLDGLPDTARDAARMEAKQREKDGYVFTLDFPSYSAFLTYSTKRELRKKMYMAYNTLCTKDNSENNIDICKRLVNLRREIAQLLGYKTYADYVLEERMATNATNVYDLLDRLVDAYKPTAEKEQEELKTIARKMEGDDFEMMPWDMSFYSHKLKMECYNLDA